MKKPLQLGFRPWESHTTALAGDGNAAPPLVAGATTFTQRNWILRSLRLPYESSSLE